MDEVADDVHCDVAAAGFGFDRLDLGVVAVHQGYPGAAVARVAALSLGEPAGDDGGDVLGDRGGQPLAGGLWPGIAWLAGVAAGQGDDVSRDAGAGIAS